jgi:hypothetical protein
MQTRITNIFPLRKSNRKTKSQQEVSAKLVVALLEHANKI